MDSDSERSGGSARAWRILAWLTAMPVIYLLGSGPVRWMHQHRMIPDDVLTLYVPLARLEVHSRLFSRLFPAYWNLWAPYTEMID